MIKNGTHSSSDPARDARLAFTTRNRAFARTNPFRDIERNPDFDRGPSGPFKAKQSVSTKPPVTKQETAAKLEAADARILEWRTKRAAEREAFTLREGVYAQFSRSTDDSVKGEALCDRNCKALDRAYRINHRDVEFGKTTKGKSGPSLLGKCWNAIHDFLGQGNIIPNR